MTKNAVVEKWCRLREDGSYPWPRDVDAAISELSAEVDRLQALVDELLAQHEADVAHEWDGRGMSRDEIALRLLVGMASGEVRFWDSTIRHAFQGADAFLAAVAEKKTK